MNAEMVHALQSGELGAMLRARPDRALSAEHVGAAHEAIERYVAALLSIQCQTPSLARAPPPEPPPEPPTAPTEPAAALPASELVKRFNCPSCHKRTHAPLPCYECRRPQFQTRLGPTLMSAYYTGGHRRYKMTPEKREAIDDMRDARRKLRHVHVFADKLFKLARWRLSQPSPANRIVLLQPSVLEFMPYTRCYSYREMDVGALGIAIADAVARRVLDWVRGVDALVRRHYDVHGEDAAQKQFFECVAAHLARCCGDRLAHTEPVAAEYDQIVSLAMLRETRTIQYRRCRAAAQAKRETDVEALRDLIAVCTVDPEVDDSVLGDRARVRRAWQALRSPPPEWRHHAQTTAQSCTEAFERGLGLLLRAFELVNGADAVGTRLFREWFDDEGARRSTYLLAALALRDAENWEPTERFFAVAVNRDAKHPTAVRIPMPTHHAADVTAFWRLASKQQLQLDTRRTGLDSDGLRIVLLSCLVEQLLQAGALEPGELDADLVHETACLQRVVAQQAIEAVEHDMQPLCKCAPLLAAKHALYHRSEHVETELARAATCVSQFSIFDLASALQPRYLAGGATVAMASRIRAAVGAGMEGVPMAFTDFLFDALPFAMHLLTRQRAQVLTTDATALAMGLPFAVGDQLRVHPRIRNRAVGDEAPLLLTMRDANALGAQFRALLDALAQRRCVVFMRNRAFHFDLKALDGVMGFASPTTHTA
jgi:hypothetical protein